MIFFSKTISINGSSVKNTEHVRFGFTDSSNFYLSIFKRSKCIFYLIGLIIL